MSSLSESEPENDGISREKSADQEDPSGSDPIGHGRIGGYLDGNGHVMNY